MLRYCPSCIHALGCRRRGICGSCRRRGSCLQLSALAPRARGRRRRAASGRRDCAAPGNPAGTKPGATTRCFPGAYLSSGARAFAHALQTHASAESIAEVDTNPKACSGANSCYIARPKSRAVTGAQALSSRLNSPRPSPVTDACAEQAADARAVTIGSQTPTLMPSRQPSSVPSPMPTKRSIPRPNPAPTLLPSPAPTKLPSPLPTNQPTPVPRPTVSCPFPTPPRLLFQRDPSSAPVLMQQPTHSLSPVPPPWPTTHVNAYQPAHPTA